MVPATALKLARIKNDVRIDLDAANFNSLINAAELFPWVPNSSPALGHNSKLGGSAHLEPKPSIKDDVELLALLNVADDDVQSVNHAGGELSWLTEQRRPDAFAQIASSWSPPVEIIYTTGCLEGDEVLSGRFVVVYMGSEEASRGNRTCLLAERRKRKERRGVVKEGAAVRGRGNPD